MHIWQQNGNANCLQQRVPYLELYQLRLQFAHPYMIQWQRKSAHDFFEREVARKRERNDYLKRLESKKFGLKS